MKWCWMTAFGVLCGWTIGFLGSLVFILTIKLTHKYEPVENPAQIVQQVCGLVNGEPVFNPNLAKDFNAVICYFPKEKLKVSTSYARHS